MNPLEYLTLLPDGCDESCPYPLLIWLHGFGADMHDLAGLAEIVGPSDCVHVLPNAPLGGFGAGDGTIRAWYERGGKEKPESVRLALDAIDTFTSMVLARFRVPERKALLVGFSQGGSLALRYGLTRPERFAGLAIMSGSLHRVEELRETLPASRDQALFVAHGVHDTLVPVSWGRRAVTFLREQGYAPEYREYPVAHAISLEESKALRAWVSRVLPPSPPLFAA
jgi:phospholipase/carboxylesterase